MADALAGAAPEAGGCVPGGPDVPFVAAGALAILGKALGCAMGDRLLAEAFRVAARAFASMSRIGGEAREPLCVVVELLRELDASAARECPGRADAGEMGRQAACEAVLTWAGELPRKGGAEGFGRLCQLFFGVFMARFLDFYLSRIAADRVGVGAIEHVGDVSAFSDHLRRHCVEQAMAVAPVAAERFGSLAGMPGLEDAAGFVASALRMTRERIVLAGQGRAAA